MESAKDMERVRKTMAASCVEFDSMKLSLMKDLQNRCEKVRLAPVWARLTNLQVIELEISLDETQEQYKNVMRHSNGKTQQRKMDFLSRNLDQLTLVQKQVRSSFRPLLR